MTLAQASKRAPPEDPARLLTDIAALTALPTVWTGATHARMAETLVEALHRLLSADTVQVTLRPHAAPATSLLRTDPHPAEGPSTRQVEAPIGPAGARGMITASWVPPREPTRADRLLLSLAANQIESTLRAEESDRRVAQTQAQLGRVERLAALGQLVGGVAHEVRTPLTAITNGVEILRRRLPADPRLEQVVDDIVANVDRLNHLIRDLRRFSQKGELAPACGVELSQPVAEALHLFHVTHPGSVRVQADLAPTPRVRVDALGLEQVVLNLLENAVQATPGHGHVRIATRAVPMHEGQEAAQLVVEDDGAGMPAEVVARMYDPLFTTKEGGSGLGLSIVRRIVEDAGARIACASAPGKGTRFTLTFAPGEEGTRGAGQLP